MIQPMGKETFVLANVNKPKFENIGGDNFCTSMIIKKSTGQNWSLRYQNAIESGEPTIFQFYSYLGYTLKAPITHLQATEYDQQIPYDILDVYIKLTPEQLVLTIPPEISTEFGY